jgi:hypothetical protein
VVAEEGAMSGHPATLKVRVRDTARFDYLCEMPGWPHAGWFNGNEVERV